MSIFNIQVFEKNFECYPYTWDENTLLSFESV